MLTEPPWVIKHRYAFCWVLFFVNMAKLGDAAKETANTTQRFVDAIRKNFPMDDWYLEADS
jgi:hypothetical protein